MGVLGDKSGWCFCSGGGRSERIKGGIFSGKSPAIASITGGGGGGTGFLIHRNLLLTTHANIPSPAAAEAAEVRVHRGRVLTRLVPHRFFITSSILDLTIVGLDALDGDSTSQGYQLQHLKTCSNLSLDHGSVVYLLGHTYKQELMLGEGKVVIATDNLIKLSTDGVTWSHGSAGFDPQGNLAFMVCDPMKLATSPSTKSSSSSLSWKKDVPMQFGIPIPIIRDWLHQHWEGNLDELSKPKLPLIRLISSGHKSEHSCASFTQRCIFKPTGENEQGIPTPVIAPTQLLDINFPPRVPRSIVLPLPLKHLLVNSAENNVELDRRSEVQSSSSPLGASGLQCGDGFSSGEETMYSAETMESRNIPSPRENKFQQVTYNRWVSTTQRNPAPRRAAALKKQMDYFSPTVSSSMKKRNGSEQPMRPRRSVIQASSRVMMIR